MTLYQKMIYILPEDSVEIMPGPPLAWPIPPFGTNLFKLPTTFMYNTYGGAGSYAALAQGLVGMMAADANSPWGNYSNAGYRIFTKPDGTMDVLPFMEAMSALSVYGEADEGKTQAQLLEIAKTRPIETRCGFNTAFVRGCAPTVGITTRQVHLMNVTSPNYFADGHVLLEAKEDGKWKVFDTPNKLAFEDASGELLSLADVIQAGVENCTRRKLSQPRVGRTEYTRNPNWINVFFEAHFRNDALTLDWLMRVYQVPGMAMPGGGIEWGLSPALIGYKSFIENYPGTNGYWTAIPLADWIDKHYC